jgi:hypothetical protein
MSARRYATLGMGSERIVGLALQAAVDPEHVRMGLQGKVLARLLQLI